MKVRNFVLAFLASAALILGLPAPAQAVAPHSGVCGFDYSYNRPSIDAVVASGCKFVVRYVDVPGISSKNITRSEDQQLQAHGINVVLVFERSARRAAAGCEAGRYDANRVTRALRSLGRSELTPVYYAVDFDAKWYQVSSYARCWAQVRSAPISGLYGSVRIVKSARAEGLVSFGWATYAWRYNQAWPSGDVAQLRQVQNGVRFGGGNVDINYAMSANYGQTLGNLSVAPGNPATGTPIITPRVTNGNTYIVRRGDTVSAIARRNGTTVTAIAKCSGLRNVNRIYPGQRLCWGASAVKPAPKAVKTVTVQRGDYLAKLAPKCPTNWRALAAKNGIRGPRYTIYPRQVLRCP